MSDNEQENENRETVADIVAEMRKESKKVRTVIRPDGYGDYEEITLEGNPYLKNVADRIEAAWKRERSKVEADALAVGGIVEAARTAEKSSAVVNAAAMREALEAMNRIDTRGLKRLLCELVEADIFDGGQINKTISAVEKARRALSAPPSKGKWKNGRRYEYEYAYCSECGRMQWAGWDTHKQAEENIESFACDYKYCPGCGAEMEGGVYVK